MASSFTRFLICTLFTPIPNLPIFILLLFTPLMPAVRPVNLPPDPNLLAATYVLMVLAFAMSRYLIDGFLAWYRERPITVDSLLLLLGLVPFVLHCRFPGMAAERFAFTVAFVGYACWFRVYFVDEHFETFMK